MTFQINWHTLDVAKQWPAGSAVAIRMPLSTAWFHDYAYVIVANWKPDLGFWLHGNNGYLLLEEPKKKE